MKLSYGWVVVGAGMLLTCVGIGSMFSLAVFLQPIATDTGWSRSGISMAATLDFLFMGAASFFWGGCPTGSARASSCCWAACS